MCDIYFLIFFFIQIFQYCYVAAFRMPVLPIEQELSSGDPKSDTDDDTDLENYITKMKTLKRGIYERVHDNIKISQICQKKYYDKN